MSDWILADSEPQPDGFFGGDGACESVSIRFFHVTEPAIVTVYLYAVDRVERGWDEDEEFPFDVEQMIEWRIVEDREDPSAAEVWTDYTYDHPSAVGFRNEIAAEDFRDLEAADWIASGADLYLNWDGRAV